MLTLANGNERGELHDDGDREYLLNHLKVAHQDVRVTELRDRSDLSGFEFEIVCDDTSVIWMGREVLLRLVGSSRWSLKE